MRKTRLACLLLSVLALGTACAPSDWRTANRDSAGIAPDPKDVPEALVQVYAARAFSWRGWFGVHTWVAVKPTDAPEFTVYEVIGWRVRHGMSGVSISNRPADGRWFGADPELIAEIRGDGVDAVIARLDAAARDYPHADEYSVWPGPNSNTFIAWLGRHAPELRLDLPPTAIGKDYIPGGGVFAGTPSGTGWQVSLAGLLGLLVGWEEGIELNLLGLTFGLDAKDPAVKLPMVGRLG